MALGDRKCLEVDLAFGVVGCIFLSHPLVGHTVRPGKAKRERGEGTSSSTRCVKKDCELSRVTVSSNGGGNNIVGVERELDLQLERGRRIQPERCSVGKNKQEGCTGS